MQRGPYFEGDHARDTKRLTTVGNLTNDSKYIDYLIDQMIKHHNLSLYSIVRMCEKHHKIWEETRLIKEIFSRTQIVEDMITFLVYPLKVKQKYGLNMEQCGRFTHTISKIIKENFDFYQFYFIGVDKNTFLIQKWFQFLIDPSAGTFYSAIGYLTQIFLPFVKYEYRSSTRICDYYEQKPPDNKNIHVINIFSEKILNKILDFVHFEGIFKIIFSLILVSLEEDENIKSIILLKQLCGKVISKDMTSDRHLQGLVVMMKDMSLNSSLQKCKTILSIIGELAESNIPKACIKRIEYGLSLPQFKKNGQFYPQQQCIMQQNIKIISQFVSIYYLLRKNGIDHKMTVMTVVQQKIIQIFKQLKTIMQLAKLSQPKIIKFTSGQNIKSVSFYRYQVFNLIKVCLTLVKDYSQVSPELCALNCYELGLLSLLQKYLEENRWNSIMHCLIQKIVCLLINIEYFKSKNKQIMHQFLDFLIVTFNNKKFMFLNSTRMTSQGDIHSLYYISRKIANQLQKATKLFNVTNQYDTWRKFIVNNVKIYQQKIDSCTCKPPKSQQEQNALHEKDEYFRVQIDQLALIKEIVQKIQINKKWTMKRQCKIARHLSRSSSNSSIQKSIKANENINSPKIISKHQSSFQTEKVKSLMKQLSQQKNLSHSAQLIVDRKDQVQKQQLFSDIYIQSSHSDSEISDDQMQDSLNQKK